MINFSKKTTLLSILLVVFLITAGVFAFQWWQVKGELGKQIEQNENLAKQVNKLQAEIDKLKKEVEELKVSEGIIEETAGWKIYRNEKYGFEIRFPSVGKWDFTIWKDKDSELGPHARFFDASFKVSEEENEISFYITVNLVLGCTPSLPPGPFCRKSDWKSEFSHEIYSSYDPKIGDNYHDCNSFVDGFLLDTHSTEVRLCVSKDLQTYYPLQGSSGSNGDCIYYCEGEEDSLYHFVLHCEGKNWQGREGRNECNKLFNQIVSTFKFIK